MNDPYQLIPQIFYDARQNQSACARVAVVGPRLSGKTVLLNSVSADLRKQASANLLQVRLDLAVERFKDFDDPARQLAATLSRNVKQALPRTLRVELPRDAPLSGAIEKLLLGLPDRHILLEIDHLEAAPLYVARALAEQLHPLLDVGVSSDAETAQRLGVLVCGSISLHTLLDVRTSGFIHCERIPALVGDPDVRRAAAERLLRTQSWTDWGRDVAAALAEWTGGEPAFALPVFDALDHKRKLTPAAVQKAALRISDVSTRLPVLRELAMELHRNSVLRALVVSALDKRQNPIALDLGAPSEISEAELSGVFIAHQRRYEFRNSIVQTFIQNLLAESKRLSPWLSTAGPCSRQSSSAADDALQLPERVDNMAREMAAEASIWAIILRLKDLWEEMLPAYGNPKIAVLGCVEGGWYRFDAVANKIVPLDDQSPHELVWLIAEGAKRAAERAERKPAGAAHAAFFGGDDGRLAVGVPVGNPERMVAVVTTVRRQDRGGAAWSEPSLRNWIWFLRQHAGSNLLVRGVLEVLQHLREESRGQGALRQSLSGLVEDVQRFRGEMVIHSRLDRFNTRFRNWGNAILTEPLTDELVQKLSVNLGNYRAGWEEICTNEFAEVTRAVSEELSSAHPGDVAREVGLIVASVTNISAAIEARAFADWTKAVKSLRRQLERAMDLSRGTPGRLQGIIARAHEALGNGFARPAPAPRDAGATRPQPAEPTPEFHVLLSHNSCDKETIRLLGEQLERRALKPWLDEWELQPGQEWQDGLEEIIQTCGAAAICVSSSGVGPWEEPEMKALLRRSVDERKAGKNFPIIPVLLPGAPDKAKLSVFLEGKTWVDLRSGMTPDGIDRLIWGITGTNPHS